MRSQIKYTQNICHPQSKINYITINESYLLSVYTVNTVYMIHTGRNTAVLLRFNRNSYSFVVHFRRKGRLSGKNRTDLCWSFSLMLFSLNVISLNRFVVRNSMRLLAACRFMCGQMPAGTRLMIRNRI